MTDTIQQRLAAWRVKRAAYPRFRQALLWIRDIGLIVDAALCLGLALLASPTVLTDHPWLQSYVTFMGGYFGAVYRLSEGAIYPQVSKLVFAMGWGVALVPFMASLLHSLIYLLVLDDRTTKAEVVRLYNSRFSRTDVLNGFVECLMGPSAIAMVVFFSLAGC